MSNTEPLSYRGMEYRRLGASGMRVSSLSLGGWTTYGGIVKDSTLVKSILTTAFEAGVNFFDIADAYARGEAEKEMGKVFQEWKRSELVISSKLYWPMSEEPNDRGLSRKHIMESVEKSLRHLGTDYLDIYFCHRFDPLTPLEETVRAMDDLVTQGKILYWGTSEWTGDQIREAHEIADRRHRAGPQVEQPQYHLLCRHKVEDDVQPACKETGMGIVTWSPLASGLLTGKYDDGIPEGSRLDRIEWLKKSRTEDKIAKVKQMAALAEQAGCSRTQLALAWGLTMPGISSVIMGATSVEQLQENLGAREVNITPEIAQALDSLFPSEPEPAP
ncbi:MAG: aldo/keto reductase [Planctomycetota bacterium]|jgi:voltage-dependent potassium channel beta subunit